MIEKKKNKKIVRPSCPYCKSTDVAWIQWGMPVEWNEEQLKAGEIKLGGCCIKPDSERWECQTCGRRFGNIDIHIIIRKKHGENIPDYIEAHEGTYANEAVLKQSRLCGCYYCGAMFVPGMIKDWIDDVCDPGTAICPYCGHDTVIGDKSGFSVTKEFLKKMHDYWGNN